MYVKDHDVPVNSAFVPDKDYGCRHHYSNLFDSVNEQTEYY
jgi:hypothetical protein